MIENIFDMRHEVIREDSNVKRGQTKIELHTDDRTGERHQTHTTSTTTMENTKY